MHGAHTRGGAHPVWQRCVRNDGTTQSQINDAHTHARTHAPDEIAGRKDPILLDAPEILDVRETIPHRPQLTFEV